MKIIKERYYSYELFDSLVDEYTSQYSPDSHEIIWDEINDRYGDEDLANDVIAALEDAYESYYGTSADRY